MADFEYRSMKRSASSFEQVACFWCLLHLGWRLLVARSTSRPVAGMARKFVLVLRCLHAHVARTAMHSGFAFSTNGWAGA